MPTHDPWFGMPVLQKCFIVQFQHGRSGSGTNNFAIILDKMKIKVIYKSASSVYIIVISDMIRNSQV